MMWQQQLKALPWLYNIASNYALWKRNSFLFALLLNFMVAACFPFDKYKPSDSPKKFAVLLVSTAYCIILFLIWFTGLRDYFYRFLKSSIASEKSE
jgi:hypothetical protein